MTTEPLDWDDSPVMFFLSLCLPKCPPPPFPLQGSLPWVSMWPAWPACTGAASCSLKSHRLFMGGISCCTVVYTVGILTTVTFLPAEGKFGGRPSPSAAVPSGLPQSACKIDCEQPTASQTLTSLRAPVPSQRNCCCEPRETVIS